MLVLRYLSLLASATFFSGAIASSHHDSAHAHLHQQRGLLSSEDTEYDYVVVGTGAGGGPLAARLAINGFKVLVLESGDDQGFMPQQSIPAFFPAASEFEPMSWDIFVRHYEDEARDKKNSKATYETPDGSTYVGLDPPEGSTFKGIWYPRSGTLGGCAAHNALVSVYPHEQDWQELQDITGDESWSPANMRKFFERLEKNEYLKSDDSKASGHGFTGWLPTDTMPEELMLADPQLLAMLEATASALNSTEVDLASTDDIRSKLFPRDMNTDYPDRDTADNIYNIPLAMGSGKRKSPRDFLLATAADENYDLTIKLNSHATKVLFDTSDPAAPVATGLEYLSGTRLYGASPLSNKITKDTAAKKEVKAKEVIISGGTFNSPQILKLSGIGPADELTKNNIPQIVDLPGVGQNLQDHYEMSTTVKFPEEFSFLSDCTFFKTGPLDPCFLNYTASVVTKDQRGPYASNLLPASILKTSSVSKVRDTFVFGGPVNFKGYFQGYTDFAIADSNHWSYLTLKAHEGNHAGTVLLRSNDPLEQPDINFHFFDDGTETAWKNDIQPLVEAIEYTRDVYAALPEQYRNGISEEFPGASVKTTEQLEDFIKQEAWGHHATGTCKMGPKEDNGVVDSEFKVHGVQGLRVVDASIFPTVPGFFPVMSTYMIGEKAAEVITEGAKGQQKKREL